MTPFVYTGLPARVIFGHGTLAQLPAELERLGASRALVLSTPGHQALADEVATLLGERAVGTCAIAALHTPVAVTLRAMSVLDGARADALVAVGGGSAIGLAKALALRTDLPQIVLPTTYAGSEMTPILGETEGGVKTTRRSPRVLPEVVVYDVALTLSLPPAVASVSGLNAVAHAVEALYAQDRNPIVDLLALEAIRKLADALPQIVERPEDRGAREAALYGALLAGACLGSVGMGLHHKLCHTLGGTFDLPHAATHAVVLPHAAAYNAPSVPAVMADIASALQASTAAGGLFALARRLDVPASLRALGMPESGIDQATDLAMATPYWNPRPLDRAAVRDLIAAAWSGAPPKDSGWKQTY